MFFVDLLGLMPGSQPLVLVRNWLDGVRTKTESNSSKSAQIYRFVPQVEKLGCWFEQTFLVAVGKSHQAQLDSMVPVLRGLSDLEHHHAALEASQSALTTQSARLREMNAALGAQLLAEKGAVQEVEPTAESVIKALQLRQKLQARTVANQIGDMAKSDHKENVVPNIAQAFAQILQDAMQQHRAAFFRVFDSSKNPAVFVPQQHNLLWGL